jgi:hypothetical protein
LNYFHCIRAILTANKKPLHVGAGVLLFWLLNLGSNQGPTD